MRVLKLRLWAPCRRTGGRLSTLTRRSTLSFVGVRTPCSGALRHVKWQGHARAYHRLRRRSGAHKGLQGPARA
eukprot:5482155-Alexandrium_andersonii.AAC.1